MINLPLQLPNGGIATFHRLQEIRSVYPFNHVNLEVCSYASEAAYLLPSGPMWSSPVAIPVFEVTTGIVDAIEAWLITNEDSPFKGGTLSVDNSQTLEAAQNRAWTRMKAYREQVLNGSFSYNGDVYQINKTDVNGAFSGASYCLDHGVPYSTDWTLENNEVRTLDAQGVVNLGLTLLKFVDDVHAHARDLRALIYTTGTIEEVNAINWTSATTPNAVSPGVATGP